MQIAVKEIYTAFQRGTVDGLAWPTIGFPDLGIDDYVHYRIDPDVLQLAITLQINLENWKALSPEAQAILTEQAIIYEQQSRVDLFAIRDREVAELEAAGFNPMQMEPDSRSPLNPACASPGMGQVCRTRTGSRRNSCSHWFYPEGMRVTDDGAGMGPDW